MHLEFSEEAMDLTKLHLKGLLPQSERADAFFTLFDDEFKAAFRADGYGHRIAEMDSNWKIFEDSGYVIFQGSIAKSDSDFFTFVWVFDDQGKGHFETVFRQIGKEVLEGTEYPASIVPRKLTSDQRSALEDA